MSTDVNNCHDKAHSILNYLTTINNHYASIFNKNNAEIKHIADFAFFDYFAAIAMALSDALNDK